MSIKCRLIFLLTLLPVYAYCQKLNGKIVNGEGFPLEQVAVKIEGENLSKMTISDKNGQFNFSEFGVVKKITLSCYLFGYAKLDTVLLSPYSIPLTLKMKADTIHLKTVNINKTRSQLTVKADRLVFSIENDPNFNGNNGLEVLSKVPLVTLDRGVVQIVGKSTGAGIMVDGKLLKLDGQSVSQYISTLNAANISKIEVITQPSAEYEAGSAGGLINVITKQQKAPGLFALLTTNYTRTTYDGINQILSMNYNVKKLMLYGNLGYSKGASGSTATEQRLLQNSSLSGSDKGKTLSSWVRGSIAAEYPIAKRSSLGASFNLTDSKPDMSNDRIQQLTNISTGLVDSIVRINDANDISFRNMLVNLHLNSGIGKSTGKLSSDFDYFVSHFDNIHNTLNIVTDANGVPDISADPYYRSGRLLTTKGLSWSADIVLPIKDGTFSFGGKFTTLRNENIGSLSLGEDETNVTNIYDDTFRFREVTEALYATANRKLSKVEVKFGLRAEATQTKGTSISLSTINSKSYISLFPSVYLSYQSSAANSISFSYARKIGRPNFSALNPARIYSSRFDYSLGNPALVPYFTHSFQIINNYRSMLVSYFSFDMYNDRPDGITVYDPNSNRAFNFFGNYLSNRTVYLDNTLLVKSFKWVQHNLGIGVSYNWNQSEAPTAPSSNKGFGADIRSINSFNLNAAKTLNTGMTFRYTFPTPAGLSTIKQYYSFDLSASGQLFKKKVSLSATLLDVFNTKNIPVEYTINGVSTRRQFNNDTRRLTLGIVYNFGNTKIAKAKSYNGSSSEQSRGTL